MLAMNKRQGWLFHFIFVGVVVDSSAICGVIDDQAKRAAGDDHDDADKLSHPLHAIDRCSSVLFTPRSDAMVSSYVLIFSVLLASKQAKRGVCSIADTFLMMQA